MARRASHPVVAAGPWRSELGGRGIRRRIVGCGAISASSVFLIECEMNPLLTHALIVNVNHHPKDLLYSGELLSFELITILLCLDI